jgi:hypothetical protein
MNQIAFSLDSSEFRFEELTNAISSAFSYHRAHGITWANWPDVEAFCNAFECFLCKDGETIIHRAIMTDGGSLFDDLNKAEVSVWECSFLPPLVVRLANPLRSFQLIAV